MIDLKSVTSMHTKRTRVGWGCRPNDGFELATSHHGKGGQIMLFFAGSNLSWTYLIIWMKLWWWIGCLTTDNTTHSVLLELELSSFFHTARQSSWLGLQVGWRYHAQLVEVNSIPKEIGHWNARFDGSWNLSWGSFSTKNLYHKATGFLVSSKMWHFKDFGLAFLFVLRSTTILFGNTTVAQPFKRVPVGPGHSDDRGRRWHRKWKPRCNFAACCVARRSVTAPFSWSWHARNGEVYILA